MIVSIRSDDEIRMIIILIWDKSILTGNCHCKPIIGWSLDIVLPWSNAGQFKLVAWFQLAPPSWHRCNLQVCRALWSVFPANGNNATYKSYLRSDKAYLFFPGKSWQICQWHRSSSSYHHHPNVYTCSLPFLSSARTQVTARLFTGAQQESSASCTSSQVKCRVII